MAQPEKSPLDHLLSPAGLATAAAVFLVLFFLVFGRGGKKAVTEAPPPMLPEQAPSEPAQPVEVQPEAPPAFVPAERPAGEVIETQQGVPVPVPKQGDTIVPPPPTDGQ